MTDATIKFLRNKADTEEKKKAVAIVEKSWDTYDDSISGLKRVNSEYSKKKGYKSNSEREMYMQSKYRKEEAIKSLKPFLATVMSNKNNSLIYHWILSNPIRNWDYYRGTTNEGLPFHESKWKRKLIIRQFK